jgi:hypothetical protein
MQIFLKNVELEMHGFIMLHLRIQSGGIVKLSDKF